MKHEIYLRCHTRILDAKPKPKRGFTNHPPSLRYVLIVDTETTIDAIQKLNFGAYQFCEVDSDGLVTCLEEGLFYSDELDAAQSELLRKYVRNENRKKTGVGHRKLKLHSRSAFVEKVMYVAIKAGAAVCAFNLPFDLSRIAVEYRVAHGAGKLGVEFHYVAILGQKATQVEAEQLSTTRTA